MNKNIWFLISFIFFVISGWLAMNIFIVAGDIPKYNIIYHKDILPQTIQIILWSISAFFALISFDKAIRNQANDFKPKDI